MHPKNNILNKYLDSKICLHNFFARLFFLSSSIQQKPAAFRNEKHIK